MLPRNDFYGGDPAVHCKPTRCGDQCNLSCGSGCAKDVCSLDCNCEGYRTNITLFGDLVEQTHCKPGLRGAACNLQCNLGQCRVKTRCTARPTCIGFENRDPTLLSRVGFACSDPWCEPGFRGERCEVSASSLCDYLAATFDVVTRVALDASCRACANTGAVVVDQLASQAIESGSRSVALGYQGAVLSTMAYQLATASGPCDAASSSWGLACGVVSATAGVRKQAVSAGLRSWIGKYVGQQGRQRIGKAINFVAGIPTLPLAAACQIGKQAMSGLCDDKKTQEENRFAEDEDVEQACARLIGETCLRPATKNRRRNPLQNTRTQQTSVLQSTAPGPSMPERFVAVGASQTMFGGKPVVRLVAQVVSPSARGLVEFGDLMLPQHVLVARCDVARGAHVAGMSPYVGTGVVDACMAVTFPTSAVDCSVSGDSNSTDVLRVILDEQMTAMAQLFADAANSTVREAVASFGLRALPWFRVFNQSTPIAVNSSILVDEWNAVVSSNSTIVRFRYVHLADASKTPHLIQIITNGVLQWEMRWLLVNASIAESAANAALDRALTSLPACCKPAASGTDNIDDFLSWCNETANSGVNVTSIARAMLVDWATNVAHSSADIALLRDILPADVVLDIELRNNQTATLASTTSETATKSASTTDTGMGTATIVTNESASAHSTSLALETSTSTSETDTTTEQVSVGAINCALAPLWALLAWSLVLE